MPLLPTSIDFYFPRNFKETLRGERYLLADHVWRTNGKVSKRIIVYATDEQLQYLFKCTHILMDGTFSTSPKNFAQVYTIHGIKHEQRIVSPLNVNPEMK